MRTSAPAGNRTAIRGNSGTLLIAEKLEVPETRVFFRRERLDGLLDKLLDQFGSALIMGRTGSGKTALAADYSRKFEKVSWLSIDSSDIEWQVFARYFATAIAESKDARPLCSQIPAVTEPQPDLVAAFVESVLSVRTRPSKEGGHLIVLDNTHNVFDAPWFEEFMLTLIFNLGRASRLLIISRTEPPLPVWRLRSKQALGYAGERLLGFTEEETAQLFHLYGLSRTAAEDAFQLSYGRVSKIMEMIESHHHG